MLVTKPVMFMLRKLVSYSPEKLDAKKRQYAAIKLCVIAEPDGGPVSENSSLDSKAATTSWSSVVFLSPKSAARSKLAHDATTRFWSLTSARFLFFFRKRLLHPSLHTSTSTAITAPIADFKSCPQLSSTFDNRSTYFGYRVDLLENILQEPVTVLMLCSLPNVVFGSLCGHSYRSVSLFFRLVAEYLGRQKKRWWNLTKFYNCRKQNLKSVAQGLCWRRYWHLGGVTGNQRFVHNGSKYIFLSHQCRQEAWRRQVS